MIFLSLLSLLSLISLYFHRAEVDVDDQSTIIDGNSPRFDILDDETITVNEAIAENEVEEPLPLHNPAFLGDESDLAKCDALTKNVLAFNKTYGFLVCWEPSCGYALRENWTGHIKNKHKRNVPQEDVATIQALLNSYPHTELTVHTTEPFQGLFIRRGIACPHCPFFSTNLSGIKTHLSAAHPGLDRNVDKQPVTYQRFFMNHGKPFKVHLLILSVLSLYPFSLIFFYVFSHFSLYPLSLSYLFSLFSLSFLSLLSLSLLLLFPFSPFSLFSLSFPSLLALSSLLSYPTLQISSVPKSFPPPFS